MIFLQYSYDQIVYQMYQLVPFQLEIYNEIKLKLITIISFKKIDYVISSKLIELTSMQLFGIVPQALVIDDPILCLHSNDLFGSIDYLSLCNQLHPVRLNHPNYLLVINSNCLELLNYFVNYYNQFVIYNRV